MKLCSTHSKFTTGSLALLTLLIVAQICGFIAVLGSLSPLHQLAPMLLFQAILCAWIIGWSPDAQERRVNLSAAVKLQVQVAAQILPGAYFMAACTIVALIWRGKLAPQSPWMPSMNARDLLHFHNMGVMLVLLVAQLLGAARLHSLHQRGLRLADVMAGALNRAETSIAAPEEQVRTRLGFYLKQLTEPGAPTMSRLWYGRKPSLASVMEHGAPAYLLTWRDCPSRIRITVHASAGATSRVHMQCELRGAQHAFDLAVNPIDALALMEFMQANVLQLLGSEFALVASAARQDVFRLHAVEMQLRMLQAQIEPHFLFNTLASVRQLYRGSTEAGEAMMNHLIAYLHGAMEELRAENSTVAREFDMVVHYLAIMKVRMGERLSYRFIQADQVAGHSFPPAMLMSLVENAIMHGLQNQPDGLLTISAAAEGGHLRVTVLDNGPGFSSVQGTGSGLSNIRQRLDALYGKQAWLEVGAVPDGGFTASIIVPLVTAGSL